jgi:hypothetical protein
MSMNLEAIAKNIRPTFQTVRSDLKDYLNQCKSPSHKSLSSEERLHLKAIKEDGYVVINNYWSREKALSLKIQLEDHLKVGKNVDFENGAYIRFRDNTGTDDGVRRIYHVDRIISELAGFKKDPFISKIAKAYYGFPFFSGSLVFQHNLKSTINTRYHHIDWFGKQFKPFLYLEDVDEGNGPFTYIRGTHNAYLLRYKKQIFGNGKTESPTSFYEKDVKSVIHNEVQLCGKAGTLILADVRGLHRGSPQLERSRSILVNYMYPKEGDIYLDK